jgi:hypothetical protein
LQKHLKILLNHCKHTQHLDKTFAAYVWNICNTQINTLAIYVWKNRWNIWKQTLATYVYSHCSMCNIPIWNIWNTWNINSSETLVTYLWNI